MSLKKKKVKKGKRNKIVDVLKNSLEKADELNRELIKAKSQSDDEVNALVERVDYLQKEFNCAVGRIREVTKELREAERKINDLKMYKGIVKEKRIKGRSESTLIVDEYVSEVKGDMPPFNLELAGADKVGISDKVKKSYEPSELVDPGDLIEIDENGKIVERFDGNNLIVPTKESSKDLGSKDEFTESLNKATEQLVKLTEAFKNKNKTKVKIGDKEFEVEDIKIDIGGSKKVGKENDPYELFNKEYLNNCIDVPDSENYKDGYMDKFGRFIKNTDIKT